MDRRGTGVDWTDLFFEVVPFEENAKTILSSIEGTSQYHTHSL